MAGHYTRRGGAAKTGGFTAEAYSPPLHKEFATEITETTEKCQEDSDPVDFLTDESHVEPS
jgi:hypothetical protein